MKLNGNVEENPGPKPSSSQSFSICYWNLNSITAHNYIKLSFLRAYVSTHKFDVIYISETYLNSGTSTVDENLEIVGYIFIRADHLSEAWGCLHLLQTLSCFQFIRYLLLTGVHKL